MKRLSALLSEALCWTALLLMGLLAIPAALFLLPIWGVWTLTDLLLKKLK